MARMHIFSVALLGACLAAAGGCEGVKFKPLHGDPQPQSKPQPNVVVVSPPEPAPRRQTPARARPAAPEEEPSLAEASGSQFAFDQSSAEPSSSGRFSFGSSNFTGGSAAASAHASQQPGLAREAAAKMITQRVADAVDYGPTLVVWVVDASKSCAATVSELSRQLRGTYGNLPAGDDADQAQLLTAVVTFGQQVEFVVDPPAPHPARLPDALDALQTDDSGKEVTFAAIKAALDKYVPYRTRQRREVVFVVVTDEAGDDGHLVDELLNAPRRYAIPVYVIGVPAPFGRSAGMAQTAEVAMDFQPSGGWLPVRQGPESRYAERIQLGFWGGATDLNLLDSGFGPFALERLCRASGGRFLALRPETTSFAFGGSFNARWPAPGVYRFDPEVMRRYAPDDVSEAEYQAQLNANAAKMALHQAAQLSEMELLEFPQLEFEKRSEAQMAQLLSRAQQVAARLEPAVNKLYDTLERGEKDRNGLSEPRWQAGFDLALGRASAAKARVEGYNAMLAALKRGKNFENPGSSIWVLTPADTIEGSSQLKRLVDDAKTYLQRVVDEHPKTPWALIAARELQMPIGWEWSER